MPCATPSVFHSLMNTLPQAMDDNIIVYMFTRFCGLTRPLPVECLSIFLACLDYAFDGNIPVPVRSAALVAMCSRQLFHVRMCVVIQTANRSADFVVPRSQAFQAVQRCAAMTAFADGDRAMSALRYVCVTVFDRVCVW